MSNEEFKLREKSIISGKIIQKILERKINALKTSCNLKDKLISRKFFPGEITKPLHYFSFARNKSDPSVFKDG